MFLPLVFIAAASVLYLMLLSEMRKDKMMEEHRRKVARMNFRQVYDTEIYTPDVWKKCG